MSPWNNYFISSTDQIINTGIVLLDSVYKLDKLKKSIRAGVASSETHGRFITPNIKMNSLKYMALLDLLEITESQCQVRRFSYVDI